MTHFRGFILHISIGSSGWVGGGRGTRNMKSMWPPLLAIFFMTYFYRALGGAMAPRHPLPDPLLHINPFQVKLHCKEFERDPCVTLV